MQKKYAADGLVALSVSLDDIHDRNDPDTRKRVLDFLKEKGATFTNVVLDDDVWQEKLGIGSPPLVVIFDRQGRIAKKYKGFKEVNYNEIEPFVADLLKK